MATKYTDFREVIICAGQERAVIREELTIPSKRLVALNFLNWPYAVVNFIYSINRMHIFYVSSHV